MLIGSVLVLCGYLGWQMHANRQFVPDPQSGDGPRSGELLDKIDPNTAPLSELSMLPGLGQKRASEIIAYRRELHRTRPKDVPFERDEDLLKVRGIGVSVLENLKPYLVFPGPTNPPSNAPSSK